MKLVTTSLLGALLFASLSTAAYASDGAATFSVSATPTNTNGQPDSVYMVNPGQSATVVVSNQWNFTCTNVGDATGTAEISWELQTGLEPVGPLHIRWQGEDPISVTLMPTQKWTASPSDQTTSTVSVPSGYTQEHCTAFREGQVSESSSNVSAPANPASNNISVTVEFFA